MPPKPFDVHAARPSDDNDEDDDDGVRDGKCDTCAWAQQVIGYSQVTRSGTTHTHTYKHTSFISILVGAQWQYGWRTGSIESGIAYTRVLIAVKSNESGFGLRRVRYQTRISGVFRRRHCGVLSEPGIYS